MKLAVGSDERTALTDVVIEKLRELGHETTLIGPLADQSTSWPGVARDVAEAIARGEADEGILFCWTGTGVSIVANKVPGVRAAMCYDQATAINSRDHNNANVITLGAGMIGQNLAKQIVKAWLETGFGGGRHARRVDKITEIESRFTK